MLKFVEDLLLGAPVEWKTLGEVMVRTKGIHITASQMRLLNRSDGAVKIFAGGKTVAYLAYEDLPLQDVHFTPSIIVKSRGIVEFEYYDKAFSHKNELWSYHSTSETVDTKFVYYFLKTKETLLRTKAAIMGTMPQISIPDTENILIPLPPLPVQEKIVEILDKFTELEARAKQYEYYRNKLLTFGEEVEWKTLGEIGVFVRGNGLQKKDFTSNGIGCIHYGQIYTHYDMYAEETISYVSDEAARKFKKAQRGDLIIAVTSENLRDVCKTVVWGGENEICVSGETYIFKHKQNAKYLAYHLQTPMFYDYKREHVTGTKVIRIHERELAKFLIPLPPLPVQEKIVSILDKFHTLTNSLTEGLPREIALRHKQYEYYRDQLLMFPRPQ